MNYSVFTALLLAATALNVSGQDEENGGMADMFVHPFLAHMALPDRPGEVSMRVTPFQQRVDSLADRDIALHLEAGLLPNLGLHVRTDGIKSSGYSEVMLMYSPLHDASLRNGLSIFGQISIPTGPGPGSNELKYLFGVSGRLTVPDIMVMDANTHINLADKMAEYEGSFIFRASEMLYPELELRGEITQDGTSLYSLLGLKFRIADETALGVGVQVPVTEEREYDTQALFTLGVAF